MTTDNGLKFATLSKCAPTGIKAYFVHSCCSWHRRQDERHNCIFHGFIPKGVSIEGYSAEEILDNVDIINMQCILGNQSVSDLFKAFLDRDICDGYMRWIYAI